MSIDYSTMTKDEFDGRLFSIADALGTDYLLTIPGVYELVAEELNNDILDAWAAEQEPEDDE